MPLIHFVVLLSEILFVIRTLHVFRERGLVNRIALNGIGLVALVVLLSISDSIWFTQSPIANPLAMLVALLIALAPAIVCVLSERRCFERMRARVPIFLDAWILNLRLGASITAARDQALRAEDENLRALLRPVFETRGGERAGHLILSPMVRREFEEISIARHGVLDRLINLRRAVRKTSEFRRKSGQAARQTLIQSVVMLVLLVALAGYTVWHYGWTRDGDLICVAATLSVFGVWLMHRLARKTKWKV